MLALTPKQIVSELDRYIVGQDDAKRSVAIALRNRYRRNRLPKDIRDEITPKISLCPVLPEWARRRLPAV